MIRHLLFVAAGVTAMAAAAAEFPFEVVAPKFSKIAYTKAMGGINIRQFPSATAPRMLYDEAKIEDFETPLSVCGYWSTERPAGTVKAGTFSGPEAVVSEKDGWLEISGIGANGVNGWVSAKYCEIEPIKPLEAEGELLVMDIDGAQYGIYMGYSEMDDYAECYVGRMVDGILVCPYSLIIDIIERPDVNGSALYQSENGAYILSVGPDCRGEIGEPLFLTLGSDTLDSIIEQAGKLDGYEMLLSGSSDSGVQYIRQDY